MTRVGASAGRDIAAGEAPPDEAWSEMGRWSITEPTSLTTIRRNVAAASRSEASAGRPENTPLADAAERLSLVCGELASNGLRYARPPVTVALSRGERCWLVVVSDHPKNGRPVLREPDLGGGGIGLHLVTAVSEHVGWHYSGVSKHVWAVIPDRPPTQPTRGRG